jgi:hypothetical protein
MHSPHYCVFGIKHYILTGLKYSANVYLFIFSFLPKKCLSSFTDNPIDGVMVIVLTSSAVDCGFEPRSGQTKDFKIGICCFSAKHAALRRKSKDWFAWNQNNVYEWSDMSTRGLFLQ